MEIQQSDTPKDIRVCIICQQPLDNGSATVKLRARGSQSINEASISRCDSIQTEEGDRVHTDCRRVYINPNSIAASKNRSSNVEVQPPKRTLRSEEQAFNFQTDCIFCGKSQPTNICQVKTERKFQDTIRQICYKRNDEWGMKVLARLEYAGDCFAKDAIYHGTCSVNFRTNRNIPKSVSDSPTPEKLQRVGRPQDIEKRTAFLRVAEHIEDNDEEQLTVGDLVHKMHSFLPEEVPYSIPYMKKKLVEHFGHRIIIAEVGGKPDVITITSNASCIIHDFYTTPKNSESDAEKLRMVRTTAKLIREDIKSVVEQKTTYPTTGDIESIEKNMSYLPESLRLLLSDLFYGKDASLRIASVGQAIMQAVRPRALLTPLQIGLGVQMHNHFGSRFLLDSLHKHGFCSSYTEVKRFEANAAAAQGTAISCHQEGNLVQFVADNVDHNVRTLDGFDTFHGMGIIATSTPARGDHMSIPRYNPNAKEMIQLGRIGIHFYKSDWNGLSSIIYEELSACNREPASDPTSALDILWKISWPLKSPRPGWSGMMQTVHNGSYPGESSVTFLPMIDMSSSDMTCIYSTLKFVTSQARQYDVTPILTFDQPLWWKAETIIKSSPAERDLQRIVLRLGAFHTQMSFLGCIGHLMADSGLKEVIETIYAPNAVTHMMTGKSTSRALRGHFIVDAALNAMLLKRSHNYQDECSSDELDELDEQIDHTYSNSSFVSCEESGDLVEAGNLFDQLMKGETDVDIVCRHEVLKRIQVKLTELKDSKELNRTSKLWFQYMDMIDILRQFLRAERLGLWGLHLHTLQKMLPYFAASGHNLYAKSAYLYLQNMLKLEETHPDVHHSFLEGFHVVRRSSRVWAGLPTDLVIEQVLMRSLKTNGGLTRGRGMSEMQRLTWLMSMPACASVNAAMQFLTDVTFTTNDQHKDVTQSRMNRDDRDIRTVFKYLVSRDPFDDSTSLRNIATGETANISVNVDNAVHHGECIIKSMLNKIVTEFTFKRKDQVITLATKASVKVDGERVQVDPQLLFQRLVVTAQNVGEELSEIFKFELSSVPTSLFEASGLQRQACKPVLADALWAQIKQTDFAAPSTDHHYVLDGGSLLQRIPWPRCSTYKQVVQIYIDYVLGKYGKATVVFDGYASGPSTKDSTHIRRRHKSGVEILFTDNMIVSAKKDEFLANRCNKQRFIHLLSSSLTDHGCTVQHAKADADALIVAAAVESSKHQTTVLVGEDTDLLVLLCYHASDAPGELFFVPETKQNCKKKRRIWNIGEVKKSLGKELCTAMPFIHAFLGCDTTSRVFGVGKSVSLKKMSTDKQFKEQASVFCRSSTKEEVAEAGVKAMISIYNGRQNTTLNNLRYLKFREKIAGSSTFVQQHNLPPTEAATKFHSLRVYYQVQEWIKGPDFDLQPQDWGWELKDGKLLPILTSLPPAPSHLLRIIRCNCKTDCLSSKCSCRKHEIDCSPGCGECRGINCSNSPVVDIEDEN